jgi:glycosyltransferase involved in cell wall biosynthesis
MRKPVLTIFYQFNPWHTSIGGIQTLISSFIKYSPREIEVRLVGTGDDVNLRRVGEWQQAEFAGREISFLPLFTLKNDNVRNLIPTTVKYTAALLGKCFASDFMHFHRLEPTFATRNWSGEKTLFIHNDIHTQMRTVEDRKAILWRRFPYAYFALERLLVPQFSQIFSCNTNSTQLYQQRYPQLSNRVGYIKNSYDNEIFYPSIDEEREILRSNLAKKLFLAEQTRFIVFAGRLHPQKDPMLLLRAFATLKEPHIHLLIAGDGELAPQVRAEVTSLGLSQRVTMLGAVPLPELANLHRLSNALVLSSAYEGLPLVVLEALACGTPIVTTDCGETPRLLTQDSGIVCSQRTPECIADALSKILQNPQDYPTASCVRVATPYAARTVIKEIYNQMLEKWESGAPQPNLRN